MDVVVLLLALELPALMALLDCANRDADAFEGGAPDRRSWLGWLAVGVATSWFLVGNAVVLAYYFVVVRRNSPMGHG